MPLPNAAAVLFDMDETLLDHKSTGYDICRETFAAFADRLPGVDETAFVRMVWQKANDLWNMMFDGALTGEVGRPYTFINALRALKADDSLGRAMLEDFEDRATNSTSPAENAYAVLGALRGAGIRVGIVTNGYVGMQMRKIEHHAFHEHVDFVLVSEAVGIHKPDRGIFEEALRRAGTGAARALFVGDNLRADIAGAEGAGIRSVLIDPRGKGRKALEEDPSLARPTHIIEGLDEVLSIVGLDAASTSVSGER